MSKKVTSKSTKADLFAEIERLNKEAKEAKVVIVEPEKEIKKKKEKAVIASAEKTLTSDFDNLMIGLKNNIAGEMSQIQKGVDSAKETLTNLNTTIDLKRNEIEELTESKGQILSAFEISQAIDKMKLKAKADIDSDRESLQKEFDEKEQNYEDKVSAFNQEMDNRETNWNNSILAEDEAIKTKRKREKEQYNYDISIERRNESDKFNKNLEVAKDGLNKEREILNDEKKELESKKDYIEKLEMDVKDIPTQILAAKKAEKGKVEGILTKAHNDSIVSIGKDHQLEIAKDKNTIESLTEKNQSLSVDNEELKRKLDDAYKELKDVAMQVAKSSQSVVYSPDKK